MLFHSFPPCPSFPPGETYYLLFRVPPVSHPPTYVSSLLLSLLVRYSPHVGHSMLNPLPSPCSQHPLLHLCALSVQHKPPEAPATGLPLMSIPLSLFLAFHYTDHTHGFQYFPNKVSWTAKPHTPTRTLLHSSLTHSPCYCLTLTNLQLLFLMFPFSPPALVTFLHGMVCTHPKSHIPFPSVISIFCSLFLCYCYFLYKFPELLLSFSANTNVILIF